METLGCQLALVVFTDALSMPPLVTEYVQTICQSDSGLLVSKFAAATLALGLSLHARETYEAIKQLVHDVNAFTDQFAAMMEGDEGIRDSTSFSGGVPQSTNGRFAFEFTAEYRDVSAHEVSGRQSSDGAEDSLLQTTSSLKASDKRDPSILWPVNDPTDKISASGNTDSCHLNGDANTPRETFNAQSTGAMEHPEKVVSTLDYSVPRSERDNIIAPPCLSSLGLLTSEMLHIQASKIDSDVGSMYAQVELHSRDDELCNKVPTGFRTVVKATGSLVEDQDKTLVAAEPTPYSLDQRRAPANGVNPNSLVDHVSDRSTRPDSHADPSISEDAEQMQVHVLSKSSGMLAMCVEKDGWDNELQTNHLGAVQPKKRALSHAVRAPFVGSRVSSSQCVDNADLLRPAIESGSTSLESAKRGRRHSDGGSSISPFSPAYVPAPLKIAHEMRRRATELLEEYHKLKDALLCMLFEYANPSYDAHNTAGLSRLDLHGQMADEAVMLTRIHLDFCRDLEADRTEIITGRGLHSKGGVPVLKPLIEKELLSHSDVLLSDANPNPGSFIVLFDQPKVHRTEKQL